MKRMGLVALVAALGLVMAGCSGGTEAAGGDAGAKKMRIAVIPKGSTHEFWKSVQAGAMKAGDELGVEIIWKGPMKEDDRESQVKTVEDFVTNKVDGMVLAPLDATALVSPVEEATRSGIPVVIIDSALNGGDIVSFVATDNYKGGQMAGDEMVRLLGGKGKVVVLRYQEGSASTMEREKGFLDAVKDKLTVVSENQYGGATADSAQKAGENLLAPLKKPDGSLDIDGIYTPNESTTFGMLRVLQDSKWAGKVKFVGFDSAPKLLDGLRASEIHALVVQNPRNMGYLGVKTLVESVRDKKTVEKRVDTGATLVTLESLDKPEIKELLGE